MLTHGIDLHKRDLVIATVDAEGAEVKQKRIRACEADVLRYFSGLPGPHRAVVESTGSGLSSLGGAGRLWRRSPASARGALRWSRSRAAPQRVPETACGSAAGSPPRS